MSTDDSPVERVDTATRAFGDHKHQEARSKAAQEERATVRAAIEKGNSALVRDDYATVCTLVQHTLFPILDVDEWDVDGYHKYLEESKLAWDREALLHYLREPGAHRAAAKSGRPVPVQRQQRLSLRGRRSGTRAARERLAHVFKSLESIAVAQGYVPGELEQASRVRGYALDIGIQWQPWGYETPDEVQIVNPDIHPSFTVAIGQPGNGKSMSVDVLALDAYADGQKIVDLLDFDELENGLYDVSNQREDLRDIARERGVPPTFEEHSDVERPDVEVLHPRTEQFCEAALPYDTKAEEFVATPFVIPVSDLEPTVLKAMVPHLSEQQEALFDRVLQEVGDEYSVRDLCELAMELATNERTVSNLLSQLYTLGSYEFLGEPGDGDALDWERIFSDPDTITVFSMSMMEREAYKLMVAAYLLDEVYRARQPEAPSAAEVVEEDDPEALLTQSKFPRAQLVMREMQDAAPGHRKLKGSSSTTARIRRNILEKMQTLSEKRRHVDAGILGDTQQWKQLNAGVRENVDRVLMFNEPSGLAQAIFEKFTGQKHYDYAESVSRFDVGTCAIVGGQWISTDQAFVMPVDLAPAVNHHLDTDDEDEPSSGWQARVEYLDHEEFRPSPYSKHSQDGDNEDESGGGSDLQAIFEDSDEEEADPEARGDVPEGFTAFIERCLHHDGDDRGVRQAISEVRDAYRAYAHEHDLDAFDTAAVFGRWLRHYYPDPDDAEDGDPVVKSGKTFGDKRNAYIWLELSDAGEQYLAHAHRTDAVKTDTDVDDLAIDLEDVPEPDLGDGDEDGGGEQDGADSGDGEEAGE